MLKYRVSVWLYLMVNSKRRFKRTRMELTLYSCFYTCLTDSFSVLLPCTVSHVFDFTCLHSASFDACAWVCHTVQSLHLATEATVYMLKNLISQVLPCSDMRLFTVVLYVIVFTFLVPPPLMFCFGEPQPNLE